MKAGILVFPGSNCDRDLKLVLESEYGFSVEMLWHTETFSTSHDIYFVPGGFSYGDYLRSGAMAARARSISSLKEAADQGKTVVGICNGFQILTEAHFLPGALVRNTNLQHICKWVDLKGQGSWKNIIPAGYALPVSHSEGNYLCSEDDLKSLQDNGQIILTYTDNPNGSTADIAGISNQKGNIFGLMPHPERAVYPTLDNDKGASAPGKIFFEKIFSRL